MDMRSLPPLNSLKAFAALAEAGGFSAAGAKLNVTHAAVIQQVRSLEKELGVRLTHREGRQVALTPAGQKLAGDLVGAFAAMLRAIDETRQSEASRPVQISTSPAFAVSWLMPRLADFQYNHPDITLMINPTSNVVDLKPGGIDLAVRYTSRKKATPDLDAVLVADMVVVGTAELLGGETELKPSDLLRFPWLQELGTNEVADWFRDHGVEIDRPPIIYHMPGNLIMQAVRRGDALTYTARPFVDDDIRTGRLVELHSDDLHGLYHLKTQPEPLSASVRTFVDWMRSQAQKDGQGRLLSKTT